ncbi:MAG: signal peptidase I [Oscillospiraceae bacterium]|nr:signal peptidase I [Oscillospiraceae bacterium]
MDHTQNNGSEEKAGFAAEAFEWLEAIAFALAIVVLLFTFVFRVVSINGSSMVPTLHDKDRVIMTGKFLYTPKDGDVIIIAGLAQEDSAKYSKPLVKRVIATEGQTVDFTADGHVILDGAVLEESFDLINNTGDAFDYPLTVPAGNVFVLGDNRNNSMDSRVKSIGLVTTNHILGKVRLRIFPFGDISVIK